MKKISAKELSRRLEKLDREGSVGISDCRLGERIRVHTDPAIYDITVVRPGMFAVTVQSPHDPDFAKPKRCQLLGATWEDEPFAYWGAIPMKLVGCIARDCYLLIYVDREYIFLPKVRQLELGGLKFFKT